MDLPLSDLPDDVDALKAMVLALAREQPIVYLPSHDPDSADRLARLATLASVAA